MSTERRNPLGPVHLESGPVGDQLGLGQGQALRLGRQLLGFGVETAHLGL